MCERSCGTLKCPRASGSGRVLESAPSFAIKQWASGGPRSRSFPRVSTDERTIAALTSDAVPKRRSAPAVFSSSTPKAWLTRLLAAATLPGEQHAGEVPPDVGLVYQPRRTGTDACAESAPTEQRSDGGDVDGVREGEDERPERTRNRDLEDAGPGSDSGGNAEPGDHDGQQEEPPPTPRHPERTPIPTPTVRTIHIETAAPPCTDTIGGRFIACTLGGDAVRSGIGVVSPGAVSSGAASPDIPENEYTGRAEKDDVDGVDDERSAVECVEQEDGPLADPRCRPSFRG